MTTRAPKPGQWRWVVEGMLDELRSGVPRAESYWAQQLAFGPVLIHAVTQAVRRGDLSTGSRSDLLRVVELAFACLGALPDGFGGDAASLQLVARRQAAALRWGRRRRLARLAARLGGEVDELNPGIVPRRLVRAYPLIGWRPPEVATAPGSPFSSTMP